MAQLVMYFLGRHENTTSTSRIHIQSLLWWCVFIVLALGRQRHVYSWGSLPSQLSWSNKYQGGTLSQKPRWATSKGWCLKLTSGPHMHSRTGILIHMWIHTGGHTQRKLLGSSAVVTVAAWLLCLYSQRGSLLSHLHPHLVPSQVLRLMVSWAEDLYCTYKPLRESTFSVFWLWS